MHSALNIEELNNYWYLLFWFDTSFPFSLNLLEDGEQSTIYWKQETASQQTLKEIDG